MLPGRLPAFLRLALFPFNIVSLGIHHGNEASVELCQRNQPVGFVQHTVPDFRCRLC